MSNFATYRRLEALRPLGDLDRGFAAELADPLWLLGQQWRLGEHAGEDASSPVLVDVTVQQVEVDPLPNHPELDPGLVPLEGVLEREVLDWWTPGRRLSLGRAYADAHQLGPVDAALPGLVLRGLPAPYDVLDGRAYDGLGLWRQNPNHPIFAVVPAPPATFWDPVELVYTAELTAGATRLTIPRHDGGRLDWYSTDADIPPPVSAPQTRKERLLPNRMSYPGAPHPRWWQIEDHTVDIGGFPPDRGHFATMLLIDLVVSHADDWFTFPVSARAGSIVRLNRVQVTDSFDETWVLAPPANWHMFRVRGLDATSLLLFPTVATPLQGALLEEVLLGIDEDANTLFAVELAGDDRMRDLPSDEHLRAAGRDLPTKVQGPDPRPLDAQPVDASARLAYRYRASTDARRYWHPYLLQTIDGRRRFIQGRLANLDAVPPAFFPEPQAALLYDEANLARIPADQAAPVHAIEPATIPRFGLRLQRQWVLARNVAGEPVLWIQRRRLPLHEPPNTTLRFDVLTRKAPE